MIHSRTSFYITVRRAACRKLHQGLLLLTTVLVTLLVLWCAAGSANAAEPTQEPGLHAYESDCYSRPLLNGRVGETVRVCERVKLVSVPTARPAKPAWCVANGGLCVWRTALRLARRPGVTAVVHYGHRAPVHTITYLATR